jgi:hypothetical protein
MPISVAHIPRKRRDVTSTDQGSTSRSHASASARKLSNRLKPTANAPIIDLPEGGNPGTRSGKCGDILGDCIITFSPGVG